MDGLKTLNDFQQLLGHINWIRPYLRITTKDLEPLFSILHGDLALDSPRELTPEGRRTLELVQCKLQEAQVERCDPTQPLSIMVLPESIPAALLWQGGPLVWVYLPMQPSKVLATFPELMGQVILKAIERARENFGIYPSLCITPYSKEMIANLCQTIDIWAILISCFSLQFDTHYPSHPWLQFCPLMFS